jgi:hypothetical protein
LKISQERPIEIEQAMRHIHNTIVDTTTTILSKAVAQIQQDRLEEKVAVGITIGIEKAIALQDMREVEVAAGLGLHTMADHQVERLFWKDCR